MTDSKTNPPPAPPTVSKRGKARSVFAAGLVCLAAGATCLGVGILILKLPDPHHTPPRTVDGSNLRQIGMAGLIHASEQQDRFPQVNGIHAFAGELARLGGLNDAHYWFAHTETPPPGGAPLTTILAADRSALDPVFAATRPSIAAVVRGLHTGLPGTTPVAWTRGLQPNGIWSENSPYGGEGGHVVFLDGHVAFFRQAEFVGRDGKPTHDIRAALPPDAVIDNN